jgi:hypothetical protein
MTLARSCLLLLPLSLAACGQETASPVIYPPPNYDYLTKIELNVGRIDIDDGWAPRGAGRRVEHLAPRAPREAQRRMAEDRLVAVGRSGRAVFVIEDASIVRGQHDYEASLAVRLDIADDADNLLGQAPARVVLVRPVGGESERAMRDDLYVLVRDLMAEMNVEFEYHIRHSLRGVLHQATGIAPEPRLVATPQLHRSAAAPVVPAEQTDPPKPVSLRDAVPGAHPEPRPNAVPKSPAQPALAATDQLTEKQAVAPEPMAFVQLAVAGSEAAAPEQWERLRRRLGVLLQGRDTLTVPAEVGGRTVWRLRTPFSSTVEAVSFCESVRVAGAACWVAVGKPPAPERPPT